MKIADGHGVTPLIAAGFAGDETLARLLINAGANVKDVDTTGLSSDCAHQSGQRNTI